MFHYKLLTFTNQQSLLIQSDKRGIGVLVANLISSQPHRSLNSSRIQASLRHEDISGDLSTALVAEALV